MNNIKNKIYNFLIWSQKYTQTDMIYLAKGGFWLVLEQIVSTATAFLSAIAFANLLNPTIYGNYKYIISLTEIFGIFALAGMGTAVTQAVARGLEGSFYTAFQTKLRWGMIGSLTAIAGAIYYFIQGNFLLPIPLLISAASLPLMLASGIYVNFLTGKKLFNIQVKYSTIAQIFADIAIITALFLTKNLFWLIAVYFVSRTFANFLFYILTKIKLKPNRKEDFQTLPFGKNLSFMGIIAKLAGQLDKILLFHFLGGIQLAIYSFALLPMQQVESLFKIISTLTLPKLSQRSIPQLKSSLPGKMLRFFLIILPIVGLYIWLAPYLYRIFFPQYMDSIIYSQVAVISLLFFPKMFLAQMFSAHIQMKNLYIMNLTQSISRIILLAILLPLYGIWGAVWVIISTEIIHSITLFILFKKTKSDLD
jgi:O-antigen/teichoic acid export membrane protein